MTFGYLSCLFDPLSIIQTLFPYHLFTALALFQASLEGVL
jgi:hypothetical protein